MIDVNNVLGAVTTMQQNAQSALPVIPNNGNPAGAYNMPHQQAPVSSAPVTQQPAASPYFYPWLGPSPYMESIKSRLTAMQSGPVTSVQPTGVPPTMMQTPMDQPVMPQPVLPQPQVLDTSILSPFKQSLFAATGATNPAAQVPRTAGGFVPRASSGPVLPNMGGLGPSNRTEIA